MRTWAKELKAHTHDYVRRGGKENRRKQVSRIIKFLRFTDSNEKITSLQRLGKRHVIEFWKANRDLSDKTANDYWLGICELWEWIGKSDAPPKPHRKPQDINKKPDSACLAFAELSNAIKAARESRDLSIQKLANLSGCEAMVVNEIESGFYVNAGASDIQNLLMILNIKLSLPSF